MKHEQRGRQIAHVYLCLVPLIAFILAFALGHVSPGIYIPCWIAHSILMLVAAWHLGLRYVTPSNQRNVRLAVAGMLFVLPWVLATLFAGMGPPPFSINGWAELAEEQRFRFAILVVCGLSLATAFSLLIELIKEAREVLYSRVALTSILIAMPLFFVVMVFWGTVFTDTAIVISKTNPRATPEWLAPWRHLIDVLTVVEVCLFYLSMAMVAMAIKKLKWLSAKTGYVYLGFSLLAIAASLLPASVPEPLVILNYVAGIPAITMVMPYLMGLALLRHIDTIGVQAENSFHSGND